MNKYKFILLGGLNESYDTFNMCDDEKLLYFLIIIFTEDKTYCNRGNKIFSKLMNLDDYCIEDLLSSLLLKDAIQIVYVNKKRRILPMVEEKIPKMDGEVNEEYI